MESIEIVRRAARGDRDAFDLLLLESLDHLYAIARLVLRDADLAEDAVQEALVRCWRELPRLRDPARFDAWLYRLVVNAATDQYRVRRRIRAAVTLLGDDPQQPDFSLQLQDADLVRIAFERLRLEHRVVIVLRYYIGLTPAEIAEVTGVAHGTVRSRIHYGIEAMRAAVDAEGRAIDPQEALP